MSLKEISDLTFDHEVTNNKGIVLVDFWAEWCTPCKNLLPILSQITLNFPIQIVKMNVENNQKIPNKFNIHSIPTLILFNKGISLGIKTGLHSQEHLESWIKDLLK